MYARHQTDWNRSWFSWSAATFRAFCRRDQLQQFLRIVQPLLELWPQCLRRDLRRDADISPVAGSAATNFTSLILIDALVVVRALP